MRLSKCPIQCRFYLICLSSKFMKELQLSKATYRKYYLKNDIIDYFWQKLHWKVTEHHARLETCNFPLFHNDFIGKWLIHTKLCFPFKGIGIWKCKIVKSYKLYYNKTNPEKPYFKWCSRFGNITKPGSIMSRGSVIHQWNTRSEKRYRQQWFADSYVMGKTKNHIFFHKLVTSKGNISQNSFYNRKMLYF